VREPVSPCRFRARAKGGAALRTAARAALLTVAGATPLAAADEAPAAIVWSGFVFERAAFASAHASTIVETRAGLLAAWFGGSDEGRPDVSIWTARRDGDRWLAPVEVADGRQPDGGRLPCWNPVLFRPSRGPLLLFYRVGPSPREWWSLLRTSSDEGRTWSDPLRLPEGILGPIRAKPVELPDGTILAGSSTEHAGWVAHIERATLGDLGSAAAWWRSAPLNDPKRFEAIQPTLLVHSPDRLQALCRSRQQVVTEAWSEDAGRTWSAMTATSLPNPSAGIDSLRLADGRFLLIYNPIPRGRSRLELAVSRDGRSWRRAVTLEDSPGEYSYPALVQSRDGRVHATYTWRRERIKHVVLDPSAIRDEP
jgi:predicted neuraminidase